jgi:hypothetical protein
MTTLVRVTFAGLAILSAVSAGFTSPHHKLLKRGREVPDGMVLLIGKVVIDPPGHPFDTTYGVSMTADLSQPVVFGKRGVDFREDEWMDALYGGPTFAAITPGMRHIRLVSLAISPAAGSTRGPGLVASRPFVLHLTGDVKLTIPDDVKAVYVGTLVYYHNGQEATRIEVRNEFATAMAHLAKWEIPGVRPEDVVERLAQVVRQP